MVRRPISVVVLLAVLVAPWLAAGAVWAYSFYGARDTGAPLRWCAEELTYRISTAEPADFAWSELPDLIQASFDAWIDVPGCLTPDIVFAGTTEVTARTRPDTVADPADNVVVFIDSKAAWLDAGHSRQWIAITSVAHDTVTGEIVDADIEFNDGHFEFTTHSTPGPGQVDFQSAMTHEAGHLLGLDHSLEDGATMRATYTSALNPIGARDLSQDDVDGICALYDIPCPDPVDNGGNDPDCAAGSAGSGGLPWLLALGGLAWRRRPRVAEITS